VRVLIKAGWLLLAAFCFGCSRNIPEKRGIIDDGVIAGAESVQAWRTEASVNRVKGIDGGDYFKPTGDGVVLKLELAKSLVTILLSEESYPRPGGPVKACLPLPGVMIRFSKTGRYADVFICFECEILILRTEADEKANAYGQSADFDPSHAELVKLAKAIFPTDSTIQSLKESRK